MADYPAIPVVPGLDAARPVIGAWLNRSGAACVFHPAGRRPKRHGPRVVAQLWLDGKGCTVRALVGSGINGTLRTLGEEALPDYPDGATVAAAVERLAPLVTGQG